MPILIMAGILFVALNFYLWTLRISQEALFAIATPLGITFYATLFWLCAPGPDKHPSNDE
jgi:hypothetical protein